MPEQSMHNTIPMLRLAHLGLGLEQSAHISLPGTSRKSKLHETLEEREKERRGERER